MATHRYPLGLVAIAPVVVGLGVYAFAGQEQMTPTPGSETPTETATATATVTKSIAEEWTATAVSLEATATAEAPVWPTATPPVTEHGAFHDGAWVRVNAGEGDCLNARRAPSVTNEYASVVMCLPDGYRAIISGNAQEADGLWWWHLAGAGWVTEEFLAPEGDADLTAANAPQYGQTGGRIAFFRNDGSLWVMRPDGSEQRELMAPEKDSAGFNVTPRDLAWSSDGTLLALNIPDYRTDQPSNELRIIDLEGSVHVSIEGVMGKSWSADGAALAVLQQGSGPSMEGYQGIPSVLDVATGELRVLGDEASWAGASLSHLPAFNYDSSLILLSYWKYDETTATTDSARLILDTAGNEVARVQRGDNEGFSGLTWSPRSNLVATLHYVSDGESSTSQYESFDLFADTAVASMPTPPVDLYAGGGKCGGVLELGWTGDGSRIIFPHDMGTTGTNGIWSFDAITGASTLIPAGYAGSPSGGPGTLIAFSASGYIFIGDTAGGYPTLITDGHSPVWSSGQ